jgi:two-component system chemotaxis response regulator CheY
MAKTILIVDDNAYIRQALCDLFKREADFEVCGEAENGKEAIAKARELHPGLIVLDLSMPVMNGLDAARELKRLMPTVPLLMYSAFGDRLVEQQARLVGISGMCQDFCVNGQVLFLGWGAGEGCPFPCPSM